MARPMVRRRNAAKRGEGRRKAGELPLEGTSSLSKSVEVEIEGSSLRPWIAHFEDDILR